MKSKESQMTDSSFTKDSSNIEVKLKVKMTLSCYIM